MAINLTTAQRDVLVDCVRAALLGWLVTDPAAGSTARRIEHKATTVTGFHFSRFASMAMSEIGATYHPRSPASASVFPLSISETAALANDLELHLATDDQIIAAGVIAAHNPLGQPCVGTRDWRTYVSLLTRLGLSLDDDRPDWRSDVHHLLQPFRRAVAAANLEPVAAE
ncbi:hypothetical protein IGS68_35145 (plasmid) [Skermanella sp. TT6]|uniref:Uncharacterized protein n=1 Tax=Skermanella cutis TaxID=2775420 RepID=A0ABX7BI52_9PROT|nr:hypothetical protein [Skermanella sp. TT6]QQP94049.1 hypothetical protein IGS68_35145 [Skermanella sp. TT6]